MKVETQEELTGLDKIKGVFNIKKENGEVSFQVNHQTIGDVITHLGKFNVTNITSTPPSLEELFMTHYEEEDGDENE
jgi:ABC-2 type transport system ATP-binding protein